MNINLKALYELVHKNKLGLGCIYILGKTIDPMKGGHSDVTIIRDNQLEYQLVKLPDQLTV